MIDKEIRSLQLLEKLRVFDFDTSAAKKASEIWADLKIKGKMIKIIDIMIAAIMLSRGYDQIISNDEHYSNIDGIVRNVCKT